MRESADDKDELKLQVVEVCLTELLEIMIRNVVFVLWSYIGWFCLSDGSNECIMGWGKPKIQYTSLELDADWTVFWWLSDTDFGYYYRLLRDEMQLSQQEMTKTIKQASI